MKKPAPQKPVDVRENLPSASGMERLYLCRASYQLESQLTDTADKTLADSGTRIHNALAGTLEADLLDDDEKWVYDRAREYETEVVESVFGVVDWENITSGEKGAWKLPMESGGFLEVWRERREWLYSEDDEKQTSGELDVVYFDRQQLKALVIDYKSGYKPVTEPDANIQLRTYAVLTHERYGAVTVIVAVIQPRCQPQTARAVYLEEDLVYAGRELRVVLAESQNPLAVRVPGPAQCEYCKAKGICPELRKEMKVASVQVKQINFLGGKELDKREEFMPGHTLSGLLDKVAHVERACKAIRDEAKIRLKHGREVPGYALVPGRNQRKIVKPYGLFTKVVHTLKWMSPKDFWNQFVGISVGDLDKIAKKYPPKDPRITPQRLFAKRFGEYIETRSTDLQVERTSYTAAAQAHKNYELEMTNDESQKKAAKALPARSVKGMTTEQLQNLPLPGIDDKLSQLFGIKNVRSKTKKGKKRKA